MSLYFLQCMHYVIYMLYNLRVLHLNFYLEFKLQENTFLEKKLFLASSNCPTTFSNHLLSVLRHALTLQYFRIMLFFFSPKSIHLTLNVFFLVCCHIFLSYFLSQCFRAQEIFFQS